MTPLEEGMYPTARDEIATDVDSLQRRLVHSLFADLKDLLTVRIAPSLFHPRYPHASVNLLGGIRALQVDNHILPIEDLVFTHTGSTTYPHLVLLDGSLHGISIAGSEILLNVWSTADINGTVTPISNLYRENPPDSALRLSRDVYSESADLALQSPLDLEGGSSLGQIFLWEIHGNVSQPSVSTSFEHKQVLLTYFYDLLLNTYGSSGLSE